MSAGGDDDNRADDGDDGDDHRDRDETRIAAAARAVAGAEAILITAGAGMGVDSGLPDFRGTLGFWRAFYCWCRYTASVMLSEPPASRARASRRRVTLASSSITEAGPSSAPRGK